MRFHTTVMLREAVESLGCKPSGIYVDGTLGGAGHAQEILECSKPSGMLIGIDADEEALAQGEKRLAPFGARKVLVKGNFSQIAEILAGLNIFKVNGILLDLGVSSHQLETAERGFSFTLDAPLDMRFDRSRGKSASDLVNTMPEREMAKLIRQYGEEARAGRIARAIALRRKSSPVETTRELAEIVLRAVPPQVKRGRIHPATKTFQAFRIAVNNELANLRRAIEQGIDLLLPGGRFSVISFHSLEDRIVKETFRTWEKGCSCPADFPVCTCGRPSKLNILTKRPVLPGPDELERNPRARSAKLRTAERI